MNTRRFSYTFEVALILCTSFFIGLRADAQGTVCEDVFKPVAASADTILESVIGIEAKIVQLENHIARARHSATLRAEAIELRSEFEVLSMEVLTDDIVATSLKVSVDELAARVAPVLRKASDPDYRPTTEINAASSAFTELFASPQSTVAGFSYEVPQSCCTAGVEKLQRTVVVFSDEVTGFMKERPSSATRFLRAIQKGFVVSKSGSGIVRVPDHHEKLVEVKVIGGHEGETRLIGCRGANGLLTLKKVYVKQGGGFGGSLSHFAKLCD